jgi:hypothetical protein
MRLVRAAHGCPPAAARRDPAAELRESARKLAQALAENIRERRGVRELEGLVGRVRSTL